LPCFAADIYGIVAKIIAVQALWLAVAGAVGFMVVFVQAEEVMVLGCVAFATLEAFKGVMREQAAVGDVAQFVASAALGEGWVGNPLGERDWFAKHGQVRFLHGLCDAAILVNEAKEMDDILLVMRSGCLTQARVRTKWSFAQIGLWTTSSRSCSLVYMALQSGSDTRVPWKITQAHPVHSARIPYGNGWRRMWATWVIFVKGMLPANV
jgi:hypothetical protein